MRGAIEQLAGVNKPVRWIGGRTQNPIVFRRYREFGPLFPLDEPFTTPLGECVAAFLREHAQEIRDARFDPISGIIHGAYREGRLGDYPIPGDPLIQQWEKWLEQRGFRREAGDALAVVARRDDPPSR